MKAVTESRRQEGHCDANDLTVETCMTKKPTCARTKKKKQKMIKKGKNLFLGTKMIEVKSAPPREWRLSKWTRTKSQAPREVPRMPLKHNRQMRMAETFTEKASILSKWSFLHRRG